MKVLVFPADAAGCGSYRISWPAQYLAHLGHDIEICWFGQRGRFTFQSFDNKTISSIAVPRGVDVMVFQRISSALHAEAILTLRDNGIAVVMDMDDDLTKIHPDSVAYSRYHKDPVHSWANTVKACMNSTLVTVSTKALLKVYAKHGRGHVIDNYIRGSDLEIKHEDSNTFGWPGSTGAHAGDLPVVGTAARELTDEGHPFRVVSAPSDVRRQLLLRFEPEFTGRVPTIEWTEAVAQLGVGMAPLCSSVFNRAKSRLKVAEMSAVGVPWVASPSPEYRRFHQESGTGILASSPREWYQGLKSLLTDASRRCEMGEAGRAFMADQTIEANAWRWWEAWELALKLQRS